MQILGGLFALLPVASGHAFIKSPFPDLPCDYAVNQAPAINVTGEVPSYVNGSMFHALFEASSHGAGVVSVNFARPITASFGYPGGSHCQLASLPNDTYRNKDSVTISGDPRTDKRIFSISGTSEFTAMDSHTLQTVENPVVLPGDSLGDDWQNNPTHLDAPIPRYYQPAHSPTDANGDMYGMVYIFNPKPAYRIWRLSKSTGLRTVLGDVSPSQQFLDLAQPGPAYIHQCLLLTPRFIIIPEIPMRMSLPPKFNWNDIQDAWMGNSSDIALIFKVLDKATGKELRNFRAPSAYSWHGITAFEDEEQIHLQMTWQSNYTAMDVFTHRRHDGLWWYYQGKYAQFSMPIPKLDGSQAATPGVATLADLTRVGEPFVSPDFGVVHPGKMWKQKTRFIWGLATDDDHKEHEWFPHAIKVDTSKPNEPPIAYTPPANVILSGPVYVPSDREGALEDEGALVMLKYDTSDVNHSYAVVLDAATMKEMATIKLAVKPAVAIGLHNHYDQYPAEALTLMV